MVSLEYNTWICDVKILNMSDNFISCPLPSCCSEEGNGGCVMNSNNPCY